MKRLIILLIFSLTTTLSFSQIVQSSCEAPDSITEDYNVDAGVLALRKIYEYDLPYKDSIEIPIEHVDTVLNALLAVWNATELPARDTIVDMLEVSAAFNYDVRAFRFKCDTSLLWANNLINGLELTGNDTVDSLMNKYQLEYYFHINSSLSNYAIYIRSYVNYNIPQLAEKFEPIDGVINVYAASTGEYANYISENITSDIQPGYVDLEYSCGWGDCPAGCFYWRYWNFRVYYDCSVEYLGSHGNSLPGTGIISNGMNSKIEVYPNPCTDYIYISGIGEGVEYKISSVRGEVLQNGILENNYINVKWLQNKGIYLLELRKNNTVLRKKILKI